MVKQRLKVEEVALRAARNAEQVDRDGHRVNNRARFDHEIRFIKTQQFAVAVAMCLLRSSARSACFDLRVALRSLPQR